MMYLTLILTNLAIAVTTTGLMQTAAILAVVLLVAGWRGRRSPKFTAAVFHGSVCGMGTGETYDEAVRAAEADAMK